jgi:hypothetical protein
VKLDEIDFDTETVTTMPAGPKGDKGDPGGVTVTKTMNWNTAVQPGFYYGGNFGFPDGSTANGPGDPLNPPQQAGIVHVSEALGTKLLVQRVWDLDMQKAYTRYMNYDGSFTPWAVDLSKPPVFTDIPAGAPNPVDGDERYFQSPSMKTYGTMWKFRYNAGSASAYKWEYVGGTDWYEVNYNDNFAVGGNTYGDAGAAGPALTIPLLGDYLVEWGALFYSNVPGIYAQMAISAVNITPDDAKSCMWGNIAAGYVDYGDRSRSERFNGVGQGVMKAVYKSTPGVGGGYQKRWMRVQPVRVIM